MMSLFAKIVMGAAFVLLAPAAWAADPPTVSAGPGTIACQSKKACVLGIGSPASIKYQVDPAGLPDGDKARLAKCTAAAKPPCVATVKGPENGDPLKVKAATIKFYN
jgi:hypothetical protein